MTLSPDHGSNPVQVVIFPVPLHQGNVVALRVGQGTEPILSLISETSNVNSPVGIVVRSFAGNGVVLKPANVVVLVVPIETSVSVSLVILELTFGKISFFW